MHPFPCRHECHHGCIRSLTTHHGMHCLLFLVCRFSLARPLEQLHWIVSSLICVITLRGNMFANQHIACPARQHVSKQHNMSAYLSKTHMYGHSDLVLLRECNNRCVLQLGLGQLVVAILAVPEQEASIPLRRQCRSALGATKRHHRIRHAHTPCAASAATLPRRAVPTSIESPAGRCVVVSASRPPLEKKRRGRRPSLVVGTCGARGAPKHCLVCSACPLSPSE